VPPILKFFVNSCCFAEMLGVFWCCSWYCSVLVSSLVINLTLKEKDLAKYLLGG
jgi:hypothetical protein